ncbi:MAG: hypothetical protein GOV02_03050 [Candidatus Aenigmarchaeota archaeon]|nr:hypothetical protein [Candidatus Aenigmarchaeota archaeon]
MSSIIYDADLMTLAMLLKTLKETTIEDDELKHLVKRGDEIIDPLVKEMNKKYRK